MDHSALRKRLIRSDRQFPRSKCAEAKQRIPGVVIQPFDGLGIYTNYTFAESEARIPGRNDTALPGQAKHSGNFAVFYEKFGFSGRVSLNYHGQYIEEVGEDVTRDLFFDKHAQWDLSLSQRINRWLRVYVDVLNLTNEPLRRFEGFKNRPVQEEYDRWWLTGGIKIHF